AGDIPTQASQWRVLREGDRLLTPRSEGRAYPRDEPGRRRLHVALDPGHLAGEEQAPAAAGLERRLEDLRGVDVGVAVDHPEAHEVGLLEARDHVEHPLLLSPLELR